MKIPARPDEIQKRFEGKIAGRPGEGFAEVITQSKNGKDVPDCWCPKCGKLASTLEHGSRNIGFRRFYYPRFICNDCILIYFNKSVVKNLLREYFSSRSLHTKGEFASAWRIINAEIEEFKKWWREHGWKIAIFKRKAP